MNDRSKKSVMLASILALIALSVAVLYGYMLTRKIEAEAENSPTPLQKQSFDADLHEAFLYPEPLGLTDFELVDQHNRLFNLNRFRNHWSLVYFGFTRCPDICPPALADMKKVFDAVPKPDEAYSRPLQFVFITVDPEHDSQAALSTYLARFNTAFIGVGGDRNTIKHLANRLSVVMDSGEKSHSQHAMTEAAVDSISHSGNLLLINPDGEYAGFFKPPFKPENIHAVLSYIAINH